MEAVYCPDRQVTKISIVNIVLFYSKNYCVFIWTSRLAQLARSHTGKFVTLAGDLLRQVNLKKCYCGSLLRQTNCENSACGRGLRYFSKEFEILIAEE
jgi:hypothetical protein